MIQSCSIQGLEPVPSRSPCSNKRMRTHMVEANDFRHFFSPRVEDSISNTQSLLAILGIEYLSRARRLRKNSKCWQCRQPRLIHTHQSHVGSYTVLLCQHMSTMSYIVLLSDHCVQANPSVQLDGTCTCTTTRNGTMLCKFWVKAKATGQDRVQMLDPSIPLHDGA